ncbi:adenylate/guanylate cyclase domain-containing protein [Bradyrhizobium sp. LHD-71]|uniref:adenylate/guanylate cyclase domain-containing protein n=1 Tax=Bradyrhizobium sp. LHD-71 TaxID=3072141 RepID=UPI0028102843|nr:adenylate/guanylate cyclase domain-containing protein [Bradyrhizobium sp. LHD-71]MDQ8730268.1 adenylate/guanylate cyclase domain-containing protein [Bradyrhizobium sp. LHD-71]
MTNTDANVQPATLSTLLNGFGIRQLRLVTGCVLFAFLVSHFLNHALGNISLDAMEEALNTHHRIWGEQPGKAIFYLAAFVHAALGIWMLYERRQFRYRATEATQLLLGLSIPVLIIAHIAGLRLAYDLFGNEKYYSQVLALYTTTHTHMFIVQYLVMVVAWVHGCIGLYFWFRLRPLFRKIAPALLALAVLLPVMAALGVYQGAKSVQQLTLSEQWRAEKLSVQHIGTVEHRAALDRITQGFLFGYVGLLVLVLAARGLRSLRERRAGLIRLSYGDGKTVRVPKDLTVLEASLLHNVPHASVCGGRARCSTCRIRIVGDCSMLPEPSRREAFVLERVGTGADPAVRLACQLRPQRDLSFFRIFPPQTSVSLLRAGIPARNGQERYLVSMFVDMRGSTKLAETRLPFDTVFIINRFLAAVSQAVVASGGQPNQFVGDGQLALFGLASDPATACRQAIVAAGRIARNVAELNEFLADDLKEPLRFGIGIHGGEVIIGDIGSPGHVVFTALGDPVNVTARLQDMTKTLSCEVVLSDEVRTRAGLLNDRLPSTEVTIRGRSEPMLIRTVADAATLSTIFNDAKSVAA